jgi:N,N'-diacetylchitobiose transport system substrate-binding protein
VGRGGRADDARRHDEPEPIPTSRPFLNEGTPIVRVTKFFPVLTVAALALAACGGGGSEADDASGDAAAEPASITVWLQTDAQQGWPEAVAAATTAFRSKHPATEVKVEYQTWADHLTKLDAALAGQTPPDVVELGNTETTKYMAAGALAPLEAATFENSGTWLKGLADAGSFDGALYAVPYYAGSRAVIFNQELYEGAGVTTPPASFGELTTAGDKLLAEYGDDRSFSAFYVPGKYWYQAMSWVYDNGGQIARKDGEQWVSTLSEPASVEAITAWKDFVQKYSRADVLGDEAKQDAVFAQGKVAALYGNGWERGVILDPKTGNPDLQLGAFPMPSRTNADGQMPAFLGGSNLAVTAKSAAPDVAADWVAAYTGTANMTAIVEKAGVLPNTTSLLDLVKPEDKAFADAAQTSWFVPTAPAWANVEKANVIPQALSDILSGKAPVADALVAADAEITELLNSES